MSMLFIDATPHRAIGGWQKINNKRPYIVIGAAASIIYYIIHLFSLLDRSRLLECKLKHNSNQVIYGLRHR